jgi:hypothetical protein
MLATNEECVELMEEVGSDTWKAEQFLLGYEKLLRQYQDDRLAYMTQNNGGSVGRGNLPGNPTESAAIRGIEFDNNSSGYLWLKAIEIVLRGMTEQKRKFVELRREAEACKSISHGVGRPSWVPYLQCKYAAWMAERYIGREHVLNEKTIRIWWKEIVSKVLMIKMKLEEKNNLRVPKTPA